jgi:Fe-S oxidoreductase
MGVYDEPRALIKMVPGVEFVEFKFNRNLAFCCGAGGGVRSVFPEISGEVAEALLKELPQNVDVLVTSCPFCNYNLGGIANLVVLDLPEFLIKSWRGF